MDESYAIILLVRLYEADKNGAIEISGQREFDGPRDRP